MPGATFVRLKPGAIGILDEVATRHGLYDASCQPCERAASFLQVLGE